MSAAVLSLNPDDAVQGGLLDDADVIIAGARFDFFTYNNGATAIGAIVNFEDGEGKIHEQFYSVGGKNRDGSYKIVPNEDKTGLAPADGQTVSGLAKNSNFVTFMESLKVAGYNTAGLTDISKLVGQRAHVNRKTMPKQEGDDKEKTILLVTKLLEAKKGGGAKAAAAPKSAQGGSGASASAPASAPNAGSGVPQELADKTAGLIFEILLKNNGSVAAKQLPPLVFQAGKQAKDPDALKMSQASGNAAFMAGRSEFVSDGTTVKVAE